jgi:seryl-tRNA synthetase
MPANNSTARPKNRDQKQATQLLKDIKTLKAKLRKQLGNSEITQTAFNRAMKKLDPAFKSSVVKGISEPKMQQIERNAAKKTMTSSSSRRTGRKVKS